jgi:hypothetical protein
MAQEASLEQLLVDSFDHQIAGLYTAMPATIVTIKDNLNTLMIDAQPSVNINYLDGRVAERPPILNIPVIFPTSSTSALTFPLRVGDPVWLMFSMRGLDAFKAGNGKPSTPTDFRKFNVQDAVAIPAPWPQSMSPNNPSKRVWDHSTEDMVMVHNIGTGNECELRLKADGVIQVRTSQDVEVLGKSVTVNATDSLNFNAPLATFDVAETTWIGNISQSGNYTGIGIQSFNGIIFSTHKHGSSPPPSN